MQVFSAASPSGCAGSGSGKEESPVDTCLVTESVVTRCTMRQELHVSTTIRSGSTRLTVRQSGCTDQHCWRKAPLRIISAIDCPHTSVSFIWFIWFVWFNQKNQADQTNQITI